MSTQIKQDGGGLRYNAGKTMWHLMPLDGIEELNRVFTYGANKYAERNWERGQAYSICYSSMMRHLSKWWQQGERNDHGSYTADDPGSGLHHLAHVVWNALALLTYELRGIPGIDDRPVVMGQSVETAEQRVQRLEQELCGARAQLVAEALSQAIEEAEAAGEGIRGALDGEPAPPRMWDNGDLTNMYSDAPPPEHKYEGGVGKFLYVNSRDRDDQRDPLPQREYNDDEAAPVREQCRRIRERMEAGFAPIERD